MITRVSKPLWASLSSIARFAAVVLMLAMPLSAWAGELDERDDIKSDVRNAFFARDFKTLEDLSTRYASPAERTSSGLWKQTMMNFAFIDLQKHCCGGEPFWRDAEDAALGWTKAYPQSRGAHIAVALVHYAHGWAYRGVGWAHTVPKENWKPYRDYLVKARNYLMDEAAFAASDPGYQDLMLSIANELQVPEEEFQKLAEKAMTSNPGYYQIYFTILNHYLPKWGGDTRTVEEFARTAAKFTKETDGDGMYARIYWAASQGQFGPDLFTRSEANWSDMKRGIKDVLARYADPWNVNHFAKFACLAGDKEMTRDLMASIDGFPVATAWDDVPFDICESWAKAAP